MAFWKKFFQYFFKKPLKFQFFFWKTFRHLSYKEVKYQQSYVWGRTLKMTVRQWSSNCDAWINAHTLPIFRVFARWKISNATLQNLPFSKQKIKFTFSFFHFLLLYKFSQTDKIHKIRIWFYGHILYLHIWHSLAS